MVKKENAEFRSKYRYSILGLNQKSKLKFNHEYFVLKIEIMDEIFGCKMVTISQKSEILDENFWLKNGDTIPKLRNFGRKFLPEKGNNIPNFF